MREGRLKDTSGDWYDALVNYIKNLMNGAKVININTNKGEEKVAVEKKNRIKL